MSAPAIDPEPPMKSRTALGWNIVAAFFYAAMGALAHHLGPRCGWQLVFLVRSALGCLIAGALARSGGVPLVLWRPRALWVRSLAGAAVQIATFYALVHLPATDVITLRNTSPIWVAVFASFSGRTRATAGVWLAVLAGVLGVFLVEQPRLATRDLATLVALGSSWLVAVAMLSLHALRAVDPRAVVFHFGLVSTGVAGVAFSLSGDGLSRACGLPLETWLSLGALAACGCLAQLAMSHAYSLGKPVSVSVAGLTQVVFAAAFDLATGTRILSGVEWLGVALILAPSLWLGAGSSPQEPALEAKASA